MDDNQGWARIQQRARLYGPNETRRAVCAVLEALAEIIPHPVLHRLVARLPDDVRPRLPRAAAIRTGQRREHVTCRTFITGIAGRLFIDEPDAAFLARVVLEHLNSSSHGITPSTIAYLAPADLRSLLSFRSPDLPVVPARGRDRAASRHGMGVRIPAPPPAGRPAVMPGSERRHPAVLS